MAAYRHSKIAFGLFGLELDRRSRAAGWGVTTNLSHPGVAPTSLLDARPDLGRDRRSLGRRVIGALSRGGLLAGTADSAGLPALLAATAPDAGRAVFYGPSGPGHAGGPPAEQELYRPLRDAGAARRVWDLSLERAGVSVDGAATPGQPPSPSPRRHRRAPPSAVRPHGIMGVSTYGGAQWWTSPPRSARSCCTGSV